VKGRTVIQRNVTPRRREDMALRKLHDLLRMVEQIAGVGGWEWDTAQDVLTWSDELFRIFGRDPNKWIPNLANFIACVHPDDRPGVQDAIAASVTRNEVASSDRMGQNGSFTHGLNSAGTWLATG
jgi:two-component system NtrC family sensor kinase